MAKRWVTGKIPIPEEPKGPPPPYVKVGNYQINERMAGLLGHLFADGNISNTHVAYYNDNEELLTKSSNLFFDLFNVEPEMLEGGWRVQCPKASTFLLKLMPLDADPQIIPQCLHDSIDRVKKCFLLAFLAGNRCVYGTTKLLASAQAMLTSLDINSELHDCVEIDYERAGVIDVPLVSMSTLCLKGK